MANEEHIAKLEQGVEAWNQWRAELLDELDFSAANFIDENLNLVAAIPDGVDLSDVAYSTFGAIAMQGQRVVETTGSVTIEAYYANGDSAIDLTNIENVSRATFAIIDSARSRAREKIAPRPATLSESFDPGHQHDV